MSVFHIWIMYISELILFYLIWIFLQIILYVKEEMKKNNIPEPVVIGIVWSSVMSTVEWNKKEELVAEQAIKHLKVLELCLNKIFCF